MKAKTKFTRLWSILLALAMVVGMLPTMVLAAESESADFVSDPTTALALLNAAKTGTADSTWDNDTKTLTLGGVNFETTAATAVKLPANTTIVLADGTTNTIKGGDSGSEDCYGIYGVGSLTIAGIGTLNVTSGTAGNLSFGIRAESGVTIKGGAIDATGGKADNQSFGIYTLNGDLTIEGGNVKAKGGEARVSSNGLWAGNGNVVIRGGEVEAESGRVMGVGASSGIYAKNVEINNTGTIVTATGGTAQHGTSYGINAVSGGTVTFSGGTLTAATKGDLCIKGTFNVIGSDVKTILFNSNGGVGTMMAKTTAEEYTLPANGFTPPAGMQLKGWSVNGTEKAAGDKITVTANTTVTAVWETIPNTPITSAAITGIDAPVSNTALDTEAVCESAGVSNAKPTVTWDSEDDKAGYGKIYTASITLTASEGYKFANSVTATVNGNPATSVTKNANGTLTVTYTFPATDKHNIEITVDTDVRDGDAAKNPTISSGYEIEYCFFVEDTDKDGVFINKTGNSITFDDKTLVVDKALVEAFAAQSGGRFTYESLMAVLKDEFDLDELKTEFTGGYDYSVLAYISHSDNAYFDYDDNQIVTNAIVKVNGKKITDNCLGYGGGMDILPGAYVFSAAPTEYDILDGANSSWTQDSDGSLSVRGSGAFSEFVGIKVDGTLVDAKNYTVKEGSTVVTLKADYLNTLAVGKHTLEIVWTDGSASTTFTVKADSPQTGDNSMMGLWIALLFASGFGVVTTAVYGKKRKTVK